MHGRWIRSSRWLLIAPLMAVLMIVAAACGSDDPTPAPVDFSSITAELQQSIADAVAGIDIPEALTESQIQDLVERAVADAAANAPGPLSEAEVNRIVKAAIPTPVPTPTPIDPRSITQASRYGGVVPMMTLSTPDFVDPHQATLSSHVAPSTPIYNQLIEFDPHNFNEIIPDLAESWSVSDDGLSVTFKLFEGVLFHDGVEVTSEDVVFSLDRMVTPEEGQARPNTGKIGAYYDSATAVDKYTTKVDLKFPSGAFINFLTVDFFKILPKHYVETGVDINLFENAMGSGPFMPVRYTTGSSWESEKNPNYFKDGLPYFDGMEVFIITDVGTQIAAYKTERVLMSAQMENALAPDDVIRLQEDPDFTSRFDVWGPQECCNLHIILNVTKPPFDNADIRRALFLAMDRQVIVDDIASGKWKVGAPMSPSSAYTLPQDELMALPGFRRGPDGGKHPDDIADAQALMAAAGYSDSNKLEIDFLVAQIIQFPDIAQVYKQQWEGVLPVSINLELTDIGTVFGRYIGKDYQMGTFGAGVLILDPDDMFSGLYRESDRNYTGWTDPVVEDLFARQQVETDFDTRVDLSQQMLREVLTGAPPYLEYAWQTFTTIVSNQIKTKVGHYVQPKTIYSGYKHEHEWWDRP
jgi:peptide/nickel transport system substrate-binding protein